MLHRFLSSTLLLPLFASTVIAQEPDYHYPFDGTITNVSANAAITGSYGEFGYGPDRAGNTNASIFFTGGTVFSYPNQMPTNQITVAFWYKAATGGVTLPDAPRRFQILNAIDTNVFVEPWHVFITRSTTAPDEMCVGVNGGTNTAGCFETDTSWNHIALVWDNSGSVASLKGYLNGKVAVSLSELMPNRSLNPDMLLVANQDSRSLIDDLRLYNRLLTDAEVAILGEGGGPNSVEENNTVRALDFYPNPSGDQVTMSVPVDVTVSEYEIRDQMGRIVHRVPASSTISVAALSNGRYSVYAMHNNQIVGVSAVVVLR